MPKLAQILGSKPPGIALVAFVLALLSPASRMASTASTLLAGAAVVSGVGLIAALAAGYCRRARATGTGSARAPGNPGLRKRTFQELADLAEDLDRYLVHSVRLRDDLPSANATSVCVEAASGDGRKAASERQRDLLGVISHELKSPLASIRATAEVLADGTVTDDRERGTLYGFIQEQSQRLSDMIDNVLGHALIETGGVHVGREQIDLSEVLLEVERVMKPQADQRRIVVRRCPATTPVLVWADRGMITRAVVNLVSNALKYSRPGQTVTLNCGLDEGTGAYLQVADQGVGIPRECLARIFDRFYRVEANRHLAEGTGLGLNLVQEIVEEFHRGRVQVQSVPGQGSTFTIRLPLRGATGRTETGPAAQNNMLRHHEPEEVGS